MLTELSQLLCYDSSNIKHSTYGVIWPNDQYGNTHPQPKNGQGCPYMDSRYTDRVSQEECARLREGVPYVKVYRYNPKHLCPKLNGYGDNGQRNLKL